MPPPQFQSVLGIVGEVVCSWWEFREMKWKNSGFFFGFLASRE